MLLPRLTQSDEDLSAAFWDLKTSQDVARLLEVPPDYLRRVLRGRGLRSGYSTFTVPKRAGGFRSIDKPPVPLKILQEKLNYILQRVHRPKPCVHGFVKGRSPKSNAEKHLGKTWVLNVDLKDFFPSIHLGRVRGAFMSSPFKLSREVSTVLAQICTKANGELPQGAPTSPYVSNIICARLDGDLMALSRRHRLTYTRYCDDLTFSSRSEHFPDEVAASIDGWIGADVLIGSALSQVIAHNGFSVNIDKTRLQLRRAHQEVTGITVNEFANVARAYVREVRGVLYGWKRYGQESAARRYALQRGCAVEARDASIAHLRASVRGRIEYIGYVRGRQDPIYCRLRQKLHELDGDLISPAPVAVARVRRSPLQASQWTQVFARAQHGVALLEVRASSGDISMGTAFAIANDTVVTAEHNLVGTTQMVTEGQSCQVDDWFRHPDPRQYDVAVACVPHQLRPLSVDRRTPLVGEAVAVIGYARVPLRLPSAGIYAGTVESISRNMGGTVAFLQVSIQSAGGLSGSPLFDTRGRVLGVVVESTFERTQADVPGREFFTVLPIEHALALRQSVRESQG